MQRAIQFALRSLTIKRQTEDEMRKKLLRKFPEVDVESVLERLIELNYLNDREFCLAWVRHRSLSSPRGKYSLRSELKRKGIPVSYIDEALENFEETDLLPGLAQNKWGKINESNSYKKKQKLTRFLLSRGFGFSEVIETVNSIAQKQNNC